MKAIFFRIIETDDKAAALREGIRTPTHPSRFEVDPASFAAVPRSPFAYWVSDQVRLIFARGPMLHGGRFAVWSTNPLNEDFRYARVWWEATPSLLGEEWIPWAKGGAYSPIYYDIHTVIQWSPRRRRNSFTRSPHCPWTGVSNNERSNYGRLRNCHMSTVGGLNTAAILDETWTSCSAGWVSRPG